MKLGELNDYLYWQLSERYGSLFDPDYELMDSLIINFTGFFDSHEDEMKQRDESIEFSDGCKLEIEADGGDRYVKITLTKGVPYGMISICTASLLKVNDDSFYYLSCYWGHEKASKFADDLRDALTKAYKSHTSPKDQSVESVVEWILSYLEIKDDNENEE